MRASLLTFCLCVMLTGMARADSLHFRLVGTWPAGQTIGVAVSGEYAYVTGLALDSFEGLHVISISDPAHPVEVGRCSSMVIPRDVAVKGAYAFFADDAAGLRVISIADPTHLVEVGRCKTSAVSVAVSGDYAYVLGDDIIRGPELSVISVADPIHPTKVGHCGIANAWHMEIVGDYAYLADGAGGFRVISVADPTHPVEVGSCVPGVDVHALAVGDGYAYIGCEDRSFRVISIADPTQPTEVGRLDSVVVWPTAMASIHGYAFCVNAAGPSLEAFLISDPTHPALVGYYGGSFGWGVVADGDFVYHSADGLRIYRFYQLGDLDVDPDSLDVAADTLRLWRWATTPGESLERACGEFVLANTSASYNPDNTDGPSVSPVDSISFTGALTGPGGSIDSITISNLPHSLAQGQTAVCTLSARIPVDLRDGDYSGTVVISGKDTAGLLVQDSCYVLVKKFGDIDVDKDSLDVVADTIRVRPRLVSPGPPPTYTDYAYGEFILVNTTESFNPDTTDGPSRSTVRALRFSGVLSGPHGTIDSILIPNLPESLEVGQSVVCTLAVFVPPGLPEGDYSGPIVIRSDSFQLQIAETVFALVRKLGDLDVDRDSLSVVHDTMNLHAQPAGPVYSPYAKAEFVLVNTSSAYNPDAEDGPSQSTLREVEVEAKVEGQNGFIDSVYVLNLPESLAVGQAVECTLALVIPVGTQPSGYTGVVTISAYDTLGYMVQDSFFLKVRGPQPRENLDSLRVAPIPFKPNQNCEHDAIHFQGLSAGARVTVYDASGQTVWTASENGDGHLKWDAKVASGIYVYLVVSVDGKSIKAGKLSVIR